MFTGPGGGQAQICLPPVFLNPLALATDVHFAHGACEVPVELFITDHQDQYIPSGL
ncbi:MAG: hypothetical protein WCP35_15625 [Verrucomicrobiota bacterium]